MKFTFSPNIAIKVKDYEKACNFYKNILGFEVVQTKKNETHFNKDGMNFYIENDASSEATFFEFQVDSVKEALLLLENDGCMVTEKYSDKNVMVKDPYGMQFHIWEEGADFNN